MNTDQVSPQRVAAELKLSPLYHTDPNDQAALELLANGALSKCTDYGLDTSHLQAVVLMAQTIEHLGADFDQQDWVIRILNDTHDNDEQKIQEVHQFRIFDEVGPTGIDFPTYCILKFKRRVPNHGYENADVHYASDIALQLAQNYRISDLLNTYSCMELLLLTGGLLDNHPACAPMQEFLSSTSLSSDKKIEKCYAWLNQNIAEVTAVFS